MIDAGLDVVRLNFSHGTYEGHAETIQLVRDVSREAGRPVAIMQDLQGPKIRVGVLDTPINLAEGDEIALASGLDDSGDAIPTTYPNLARDVSAEDRLLLDDGKVELRVKQVAGGIVHATVVVGGVLSSNKGINLPGVQVSAATFTDKDREDLRFGVENGVDYVAMSFVRAPADIGVVKREARNWGAEIPVIAKLERSEAVEALDEILEVADGVMVARGDLGVEMAPEQVPVIQKRIIASANAAGVFVITATQMLESMTDNPRPTRAEASDVANAIYDGTDAVMLSGETAVGKYPVETVQMMSRIISEAEAGVRDAEEPIRRSRATGSFPDAIGHAATMAAEDVGARAIVAFTQSGATARLISKRRPATPIVAFTPDEKISRQLSLCWGTEPRLMEGAEDTDDMIREVESRLLEEGRVSVGENLVILSGAPVTARAETNLLKLHRVG
jgi:pyruvate kinase